MLRRIISRGNRRGCKRSCDIFLVHLPVPVITLAPDRITHGSPDARTGGARTLVEVARILLQERWKNRPGEKRGCKDIRVRRAEAIAIALSALPKIRVLIARLLQSGEDGRSRQRDRIGARLPG